MPNIGQNILWGTAAAPHFFTGNCTSYSLRDAVTKQLIDGEDGAYFAAVLHSRKAEVNFSAKITSGSTNGLDLSAGPLISVSGISGGALLCSRFREEWQLGQPKTASAQATWYPDLDPTNGASAGTTNTLYTPDQSGLTIITPGNPIIYGTYGFTHAAGVLHSLTLEQEWTLNDEEPSPDGKLLNVSVVKYMQSVTARILALDDPPAVGSQLNITGGIGEMNNHKIESVTTEFQDQRGMMYAVNAFFINPFD